jgi:hypothetical protein
MYPRAAVILRLALIGGVLLAHGSVSAQATGGAAPTPRPFVQGPSLAFVPNRGQYPAREQFAASGAGYSVALEKTRAVVTLPAERSQPPQGDKSPHAPTPVPSIAMELRGVNPDAAITGSQMLLQKNSFLPTGDPKTWITNVPSFGRVDYAGVYEGVDLVFYGQKGRLEYDFTLASGADPRKIQIGLEGVSQAEIDEQGDLVLHIANGDAEQRELRLLKPVAYQLSADGKQKHNVLAKYQLAKQNGSSNIVTFSLGSYDHSRPLVIDPVLAYGEYLLSTSSYIGAITADTQGDVYVTGNASSGFYIQKLDPNGNTLLNVIFNSSSIPRSIALDSSKNIFVTGESNSGLPTTPTAYQQTSPSGSYAPFLSVLKADGSALLYSTYLGGSSSNDQGYGVAVDSNGKAYITGYAYSPNFPTTNEPTRQRPGTTCISDLSPKSIRHSADRHPLSIPRRSSAPVSLPMNTPSPSTAPGMRTLPDRPTTDFL